MKIFLVGMPGCGKSTLGKKLARALSMLFIDLDREIEKQKRATIAHLFRAKGEGFFREQEKEKLRTMATNTPSFIMATGGGTPCFFSNMQYINNIGTSLFLDVSVEELFHRLRYAARVMPQLVMSEDDQSISLERLARVRANRLTMYQQAHITCSGDRISTEMLLKQVAHYTTH